MVGGTCTDGEQEVPRRSPGMRSIDPDSGIVLVPVGDEYDRVGKGVLEHVDHVIPGKRRGA